ncbi:unnamed protein product [Auanema sp. JU1783]|nr:unnamed protein product [Auanema sp. JU1783]
MKTAPVVGRYVWNTVEFLLNPTYFLQLLLISCCFTTSVRSDLLVQPVILSSVNYDDYSLLCAEGIPLLMEDHRPRTCHPKPWLENQKCPRGFWCHHGEEAATYYCCPESRKFKNYCHLPPATGFGQQSVRRFYYDWKTDGCHEILYTGIGGNQNSFLTYEKCETSCRGAGEPPKALQNSIKYPKDKVDKGGRKIEKEKKILNGFMEKTTSTPLVHGTYTTSPVKPISIDNRMDKIVTLVNIVPTASTSTTKFSTKRASTAATTTTARSTQTPQATFAPVVVSEPQDSGNPCDEIPDPGRSGGIAKQMWYYDSTGLSCVQFTYMGSGGNSNRFQTAKDCIRVCGIGKPSRKACELPPAIGNGTYKVPRYYFDKSSRQCELFYYSGDNGNDNRFYKKHKCERLCLGKSQKKKEHTTVSPKSPATQPTRPPERIVQNLVAAQTQSPIVHVFEKLSKETTPLPQFLFTTEGYVATPETHPTLVYVTGDFNHPSATVQPIPAEIEEQRLPDIDNIFSSLMSGPMKPKNVLPSVIPVASTNVRSEVESHVNSENHQPGISPSAFVSAINLPTKYNSKHVFEVPQIIEKPSTLSPPVPIQVSVNGPTYANSWSFSNNMPGMLPPPEVSPENSHVPSTPSSHLPVTSPDVHVPQVVPLPTPPVVIPRAEVISQPGSLTFSSQPTLTNLANKNVVHPAQVEIQPYSSQTVQQLPGSSPIESGVLQQSLQSIISQMSSSQIKPTFELDPHTHVSSSNIPQEHLPVLPPVHSQNVYPAPVNPSVSYANVPSITSSVVAPVSPISYQSINSPVPQILPEFTFNSSQYIPTLQTLPSGVPNVPDDRKNVLPQIILMEKASVSAWANSGNAAIPGNNGQTHQSQTGGQPIVQISQPSLNISELISQSQIYGIPTPSPSSTQEFVMPQGGYPSAFSLPTVFNLTYGVSSNHNSPCRIPITGDPVILCENQPGVCPGGTFCQIGEGQSMCCPVLGDNPCSQSTDPGFGQSKLLRWSYDLTTSLCIPFVFGGFQGNQNNFMKYNECVMACHAKSICSSNLEPVLPANANESCSAQNPCPEGSMCHSDSSYGVCCPTVNHMPEPDKSDRKTGGDPCKQSIDEGFGLESHQRWAFSAANNTCLPFIFKGKAGNNNNFITRSDCQAVCKAPDRMPAKCLLPPKSGEGVQYLTKYFYSPEYRQCLSFIYSGENGNENNFETQIDCLETCIANGVKFSSLGTTATPYKYTFSKKPMCPQGNVLMDKNSQPVRCEAAQNLYCPSDYICSNSGSESFCCPAPESFCLQNRPALSVCSGGIPVREIRFTYDPMADKCVRFTYENCVGSISSLNSFNSQPQCMKLCCHQGFNLVYKRKLLKRMMNDDPL